MFIWGAWVTKNLVAGDDGRQDLVQLQLQGIIGDYLQAQARSASDEQTAAKETAVFMAALDQTVEGLSKDGKIVVVHEAIIGGEVPQPYYADHVDLERTGAEASRARDDREHERQGPHQRGALDR
tara:strand:- start:16003 stop:16377 length:375 start_codon:yes stop_codon:yes gene_type:complete